MESFLGTTRMTDKKIVTMYQVDAFSDRVFGGNPAAVLILDRWLPDPVMQAIAAENNLAETAFACPNETGWSLRWFTPTVEVDFCGHGTLATAHVLASCYRARGSMAFSTRAGELRVSPAEDGYCLDIPCIAPQPLAELPESVRSLFTATGEIKERGKGRGQWFRTAKNIFVELADEMSVRTFVADFNQIAKLGSIGLAITAKGDTHDFVSRFFHPGEGIPEDPVTGSIHATLVPHWAKKLGKNTLSAFQASTRGGHLLCELAGDRVLIQGKAITFMKAEIYLS
jgi:PhzF family phenazine biosynthesis protein